MILFLKQKSKKQKVNKEKAGVCYVLNKKNRNIHTWVFLVLLFMVFTMILFGGEYLSNSKFLKEIVAYFKVNMPIKQVSKEIFQQVSMPKEPPDMKKEIVVGGDIYQINPWRVKIPNLNLDAPIVEGTSAEHLRRTVGHFKQTNKWIGNIGLAAHNRGYRCNFFQEIKKLKRGDMIIYCTEQGERKYVVMKNIVIKETDWSYLENTEDNRITLITCEEGRRKYRRCIQAIEIKRE